MNVARAIRALRLLVAVIGCALPHAHAQSTSEAQLKAAYLVSFMKYVEWPAALAELRICVTGRDSVSASLNAYNGRMIGRRPLHIVRVDAPADLQSCQQLFVPDADAEHAAPLLPEATRLPLLVVGESNPALRAVAAIALTRGNDGRLFFDINTDAVSRAGLTVSTPMLRLARSVTGSGR